jgi:hypothetical protein
MDNAMRDRLSEFLFDRTDDMDEAFYMRTYERLGQTKERGLSIDFKKTILELLEGYKNDEDIPDLIKDVTKLRTGPATAPDATTASVQRRNVLNTLPAVLGGIVGATTGYGIREDTAAALIGFATGAVATTAATTAFRAALRRYYQRNPEEQPVIAPFTPRFTTTSELDQLTTSERVARAREQKHERERQAALTQAVEQADEVRDIINNFPSPPRTNQLNAPYRGDIEMGIVGATSLNPLLNPLP